MKNNDGIYAKEREGERERRAFGSISKRNLVYLINHLHIPYLNYKKRI